MKGKPGSSRTIASSDAYYDHCNDVTLLWHSLFQYAAPFRRWKHQGHVCQGGCTSSSGGYIDEQTGCRQFQIASEVIASEVLLGSSRMYDIHCI